MKFVLATKCAAQLTAVALTLAFSSQFAGAQQPSATAIATARQIVVVTGAMASFDPLVAGVIEQARLLYLQQNPSLGKDLNEIAEKMRIDLRPRFAELTNEVTREYVTNFTEAELKDVLAFYESPVGKKLLERQPIMLNASTKYAQDWANKLSEEVVKEMRDELTKRGHAL